MSLLISLESSANERVPNIVLILADDMGYGDVGCFGAPQVKTPNIDRLASEGVRLTDFYVSQPVCSASRASLLTGCYANRVSISGAIGPKNGAGLHPDEMTLAEVFKQRGYRCGVYGKWHLGRPKNLLPVRQGFDDYYGLPYSNDMWPRHPTVGKICPPLPLIEDDRVVNPEVTPEDQKSLTTQYTERAVQFIKENKDGPFFVYLPHSMPHVPLYVLEKNQGKSPAGLYGDVISEIDWSVGEILKTLKEQGIDDETLVIFTSDNGPWLSYGNHSGSSGPLREGKGTTFEGGVRVPFVARYPGKIAAGSVCREPAMTIDLLPTLARLADAPLPKRKIDGKDIWPMLAGMPEAKSPHEALFFYYHVGELQAMRSGRWKLHFPHAYRTLGGREGGRDGLPVPYQRAELPLALYDLEADLGETTNIAESHPEVVKRMKALAEGIREELGDSLTGREGKEIRPAGEGDRN